MVHCIRPPHGQVRFPTPTLTKPASQAAQLLMPILIGLPPPPFSNTLINDRVRRWQAVAAQKRERLMTTVPKQAVAGKQVAGKQQQKENDSSTPTHH